jgi:uncharacterized protein YbjT (DUF2867 family)
METVVVTGAFSYTGRYATRMLLDRGYQVRTLTFHPERQNEFGNKVQAFSYDFDNQGQLEGTLRGASCLVNTYWVRFPRGHSSFELAVRNTITLIEAARRAGVGRMVHVSIANPSADSLLGYYRGKAQLERALMDSGLPYTIVRPTVIFGPEDILINNIAWFVRHLPVFGIPGDGRYGIRPIYVEDMARLLVDAVDQQANRVIHAVGPEAFAFEELVRVIADQLQRRIRIVHLPAVLAYLSTRLAGLFLGDVVLTWEEYQGLMGDLLAPAGPNTGETKLTSWLERNREQVGKKYASEVARHYSMAR